MFEWKIFQGHTSPKLLQEVQNMMVKDHFSRKLILDQEHEIIGISRIDWIEFLWMRSTLLHEDAITDSVLCLTGRIVECSQSVQFRKNNSEWFTHSAPDRELDRLDGDFPRAHHVESTQ